MKISSLFWLAVYYGFARYLPPSNRNIIGRMGGVIRKQCAYHLFKKCGKDINIEHMAHFGKGQDIEIGEHSNIGIRCTVPNNIKIGDDVMMGPDSYFFGSDSHRFDRTDIPMIFQGRRNDLGRTEIGNDVWIGRQCIMTGGKKIGSHSIIGAGAVICKNVPEWSVAGGNPIRIIRNRLEEKKRTICC